MGTFDKQIDTALRLIKKNGQKVIWRQSAETINVSKPWLLSKTGDIDYAPFICFLPLGGNDKEFLFSLGKLEVPTGAFYGLMGNVNFIPNLKDTIIRDNIPLEIESIDLLIPNGQKILYTIIFNG